ncbi:MAG: acetyl-CoA synthetase [Dinoroseobacter sp.]|jgi:acetyl-CoA synthetase
MSVPNPRRILPFQPELGGWDACRAAFKWPDLAEFNIAEACCDSWASGAPDRIALTDIGPDMARKDWSYGALKDASDRFATVLAASGVGRGDVVAVLLPQSPETLIAHFAAHKLGAISLPLFTLFMSDALAYRLRDSGAKAVVTTAEKSEEVAALWPELPALKGVWTTTRARTLMRDFWAETHAAIPLQTPTKTTPDDPAMIIYTSGTTGDPKGVLHGHRFLIGHLPSLEVTHPTIDTPGAVCWTPADWAWIGGLMDLALPSLYYAARLISHRMRKFAPEAAYDLMRSERTTHLFLPPTVLKLMRGVPAPSGLCVTSISSGGESLGADLLAWGRTEIGAPINEIYGQTECNLVLNAVPDVMAAPPGAMGLPVPGHDVQVQRADGTEADAGEEGEIVVRRGTPVMFLRYWNKPAQTEAKFRGDWLRTGDLGVRDVAGYVRFAARDDDVITSSGYRIGPSEIEVCLGAHSAVVMAAVVGIPDPVRTEAVKAFVVLREGEVWSQALGAALIQHVRDHVSPHVAPRFVEPIEALPMTATGKILRRALREVG